MLMSVPLSASGIKSSNASTPVSDPGSREGPPDVLLANAPVMSDSRRCLPGNVFRPWLFCVVPAREREREREREKERERERERERDRERE